MTIQSIPETLHIKESTLGYDQYQDTNKNMEA